jgi:hypothetical protein
MLAGWLLAPGTGIPRRRLSARRRGLLSLSAGGFCAAARGLGPTVASARGHRDAAREEPHRRRFRHVAILPGIVRAMRRCLVLVFGLFACAEEPASLPGYAPECNPLGIRTKRATGPGVVTMQCVLPYPSSIYETPDPSTPTGVRLDIPSDALPVAGGPKPVDTTLWRRYSGFSPGTRILVEMPGGFDDAPLAFHTDIDASLDPASPTVLVDLSTGERVAHWAEVDLRQPDPAKRVLFLHPANRLRSATRYAVGLTRSVRRADGQAHERPAYFEEALQGRATGHERFDATLAGLAADVAALEAAGVAADDLLLAWDFTTAADDDVLGDLAAVRDLAVAALGETGLGYEITLESDAPGRTEYRRTLSGTVTVPWFLDSTDLTGDEGFLARDADGAPVQAGELVAAFELGFPSNPDCYAGGADMPVLLYGHGLFGDATIGDGVELLANAACVIPAATSWVGWDERTRVGAIDALYDVSIANLPMERLLQGLVNFLALGRTVVGRLRDDPAAQLDGVAVIRPGPENVLYYGNSQGGIFGTTLLEFHPDVTRGILGVPGGIYSFMLPRSVDWPLYEVVFGASYPDLVDQRLLLSMFQSAFDISDPSSGIPYLLADPEHLGVPPKQALFIEALYDCQVPNLATENMTRSAGVPLLAGSATTPWGFSGGADGVPSALVIYQVDGAVPPPEGLDFSGVEDNDVHGYVRRHPTVIQQMAEFLTGDGLVHDVCDAAEGCVLRD